MNWQEVCADPHLNDMPYKRQGTSWRATIKTQRERVKRRLKQTPSLETCLQNPDWWANAWDDARDTAEKETGISYEKFPEQCPWKTENSLSEDWFPLFSTMN